MGMRQDYLTVYGTKFDIPVDYVQLLDLLELKHEDVIGAPHDLSYTLSEVESKPLVVPKSSIPRFVGLSKLKWIGAWLDQAIGEVLRTGSYVDNKRDPIGLTISKVVTHLPTENRSGSSGYTLVWHDLTNEYMVVRLEGTINVHNWIANRCTHMQLVELWPVESVHLDQFLHAVERVQGNKIACIDRPCVVTVRNLSSYLHQFDSVYNHYRTTLGSEDVRAIVRNIKATIVTLNDAYQNIAMYARWAHGAVASECNSKVALEMSSADVMSWYEQQIKEKEADLADTIELHESRFKLLVDDCRIA